jgi:hypothetical protein
MSKAIDISTWDAGKRSVRYRLTRDQTVFALIAGDVIAPDGRAPVFVFDGRRSMPWAVPHASYGTDVGEYQFLQPVKEVTQLLDIINGKVKPGAPLPPKKKQEDDDDSEEVDPLGGKPTGNNRPTAVRNTRL